MRILFYFFLLVRRIENRSRNAYYKSILDIHSSVRIGDVDLDKKNISIGKGSYIRSGEIVCGEARVLIGKFCAIGSNVCIRARSHALEAPTASENLAANERVHADITIGDHVWIGNNVFIKHGVSISDHAIIGANSVVVCDVPRKAIYAGVPARLIRYNEELDDELYMEGL